MKNSKINAKKVIIIIVIIILVLFGLYNITWYQITHEKYDNFSEQMEKTFGKTYVKPFYTSYSSFEKGYGYKVKYPDYLSYTGNLAITNNKDTTLIIWPSIFSEENNEYGVIIQDNEKGYQIMIDKKANPIEEIYEDESKVLKEKKEEIRDLLNKANEKWNL